ncbi:MAG: leucyl aminopeptidase family protein [Woeseia sp.]|nr:leucyl aminopeptidase family protein [Woeseia sp.]
MPALPLNKFIGNQLKLQQTTLAATKRSLDSIDQLLIVVPERVPAAVWRRLPQGEKLKKLLSRAKKKRVPAIASRLNNKRQTGIALGRLAPDTETFERLTFARKMLEHAVNEKIRTIGIWVVGFAEEDEALLVENMLAAALAAAHVPPNYKSKSPPAPFTTIKLLGVAEKRDFTRQLAEAAGNNLARSLTGLPSNKLNATEYCVLLRSLAKQHGWQYKKYGVAELEKKGAGAFLAVAQGNEDDSAAIVHLRYRPNKKTEKPVLTLVGKGIIFDTGGTNLKPFNSMLDMHIDMGGSAVAVGSLLAISEMKLPQAVDCWLAITENRTGPSAYKSQDVVTAANGKTIQVIHTDAEGRMALADTLHFASADKPALMIDYATLTGACVTAVTTRYSGVFTNRPDLHPVLKRCGRDSGERVWPFPVAKEFLEELVSETADLKQCSPTGGGDHIVAATFLNEFVDKDVPWVHVDLSACSRKGGLAHIPTSITGFGVRFTMNLLLDQQLASFDA